MLEYYTLPKLLGFAESAWAAERPWENIEDDIARKKAILSSWNVFANSIAQRELPRLTALNGGYNYRIPPPGAIVENGVLKANAALPGLTIRYTTDGSEPTAQSLVYQAPVKITGTVKLKCFGVAERSSRTVALN
jgi:hexosaminidase